MGARPRILRSYWSGSSNFRASSPRPSLAFCRQFRVSAREILTHPAWTKKGQLGSKAIRHKKQCQPIVTADSERIDESTLFDARDCLRLQPAHCICTFGGRAERSCGAFHVERDERSRRLTRRFRKSHIVRLEQARLECFLEWIRVVETKEYAMTNEKRRLGRGLGALIGDANVGAASTVLDQSEVGIDRIDQNPNQPRKTFDEDELASLSESIKNHGVLQPVVVRQVGDRFQLVAGERRLRAAQAIGAHVIPVRIVDFDDQQVMEAALAENIQRSDLNPIEKAHGFREYLGRFEMTHEDLAGRLGLDRSTVTNLVRLLDLPEAVQSAVRGGQISAGHARALLAVADPHRQELLCKEIIAKGLSVRATEAVTKEQKAEAPTERSARPNPDKTSHVQALEEELQRGLSTRVEIRLKSKEKGQIILAFDSNDDFERLLEVLRKVA
jgi:ParB family transcriptional regulator, chromosome partitioning protein